MLLNEKWQLGGITKHLLSVTSPKGNSELCIPETLDVHQGKAEGNIEVEGEKKNSLFPAGLVIKCFVMPPNSKKEKKMRKNSLAWRRLDHKPRFQGARPDKFCSP